MGVDAGAGSDFRSYLVSIWPKYTSAAMPNALNATDSASVTAIL